MTKKELLKQLGFNEYKKQQFSCEACRIEHDDEQVKQKPAHTCGIDGPIPGISELKADIKKQQPTDLNAVYNAKVREIAEVLAGVEFPAWAMSKLDTNNSCQTAWYINVEKNMDKARAMVAKMKEEFEEGWKLQFDYEPDNLEDQAKLKELCIQRGLIPAEPQPE